MAASGRRRPRAFRPYDTYKFAVTAQSGAVTFKADPYAFHAETRPSTASKLYELAGYDWGDGAYLAGKARSMTVRSTFTRSTSARGGGAKTAIFTTTARSRTS